MSNMRKAREVKEVNTETNQDGLVELLKKQQDQISALEELVRGTGNINKINAFERDKNKTDSFAYSLRLFPTEEGDKVVTSWRTVRDFVADGGRVVDQRIEVVYDGGKQVMDLVDFSRVLKRTNKILAKSLTNMDGSPVLVDAQVNAETNMISNILRPKSEPYYVALEYEGKEHSILSTFLNS